MALLLLFSCVSCGSGDVEKRQEPQQVQSARPQPVRIPVTTVETRKAESRVELTRYSLRRILCEVDSATTSNRSCTYIVDISFYNPDALPVWASLRIVRGGVSRQKAGESSGLSILLSDDAQVIESETMEIDNDGRGVGGEPRYSFTPWWLISGPGKVDLQLCWTTTRPKSVRLLSRSAGPCVTIRPKASPA